MSNQTLGDPPFPASEAIKCDKCGGDGGWYDDWSWHDCERCGGYGVISKHQWIQDGKIWL